MCHKGGKEEDTEERETVSEWRTWQVQATSIKEKSCSKLKRNDKIVSDKILKIWAHMSL